MAHFQRSHSISSNKPHCSSRPPLRHRRAIRASQPDRVLVASCRQNLQLNATVERLGSRKALGRAWRPMIAANGSRLGSAARFRAPTSTHPQSKSRRTRSMGFLARRAHGADVEETAS